MKLGKKNWQTLCLAEQSEIVIFAISLVLNAFFFFEKRYSLAWPRIYNKS